MINSIFLLVLLLTHGLHILDELPSMAMNIPIGAQIMQLIYFYCFLFSCRAVAVFFFKKLFQVYFFTYLLSNKFIFIFWYFLNFEII